MNTYNRANEALRHDLSAYAYALHSILTALPRARELCDFVVKETRLAQALLAFANIPHGTELSQIAFHLTNLWPYRERAFAQTIGFRDEIEEAQKQREEALRAVRILQRYSNDSLLTEVSHCFTTIGTYLTEEERLLQECHQRIQPHASNMELTRKRLNLLVAAVDARMPMSEEKPKILNAYSEAMGMLRDWEGGVPLDQQGADVLDRCLRMLGEAGKDIFEEINAGHTSDTVVEGEAVL